MTSKCKRIVLCLLVFVPLVLQVEAQTGHFTFKDKKSLTSQTEKNSIRSIKSDEGLSYTLEYTMQGYTISKVFEDKVEFDLIKIQGFGLSSEEGNPSLPVRYENIALPLNATAEIEIISAEYITVDHLKIYPAQAVDNDGGDPEDRVFRMNIPAYRKNQFKPKEIVNIKTIQKLRGTPLATVEVNPVQYNPLRKKARIYTSIKYKVNYQIPSGTKGLDVAYRASQRNPILQNIAINQSSLSSARTLSTASAEPLGYLIITTDDYLAAAEKLASWKRQLGFYVEIKSQNSWSTWQVKNMVQNCYDTWEYPPSYFLILGDQDDVPAQEKTAYNEKHNRIEHWYLDVYYTCMDGYNDKLPDMGHGRIPVDNLDEAMVVIDKIIGYEKNPPSNPEFYQNALHCSYFEEQIGSDGKGTGTADKRYSYSAEESKIYMEGQGYNIQRVYTTEADVDPQKYSSWYTDGSPVPNHLKRSGGFNWDGDKYDILEAMNGEGVFYMFHRDHGIIEGWRDPELQIEDVDLMTNGDKLPVMFSINCHSGRFQNTPEKCFTEVVLQKEGGGVVGIIAATEETYSGYNDAMIEGFLDAIWPNPGLIPRFGSAKDAIDDPVLTPHEPVYAMGDVFNQGLFRMTETWNGWARDRQYERFIYFGDPAMKIWTAQPLQITADHDPALATGAVTMEISNSNCTDGLASLVVNNELVALVKLVNGNGTLQIEEPLRESDEVILTISKHNYIPYNQTIEVTSGPIRNNTLEIMPLGNSLTLGQYVHDSRSNDERIAYRKHLEDLLLAYNVEYNFVGSESAGSMYLRDADHAGFPGMTSSQLLHLLQTGYNQRTNSQVTSGFYLDEYLPEMILLHIGTNDFSANTDAIAGILDEIDSYKERTGINTQIIVAKILNQTPYSQTIATLNTNIEQLVAARADTSLFLVDMESEAGLVYSIGSSGDMLDTYHPTQNGYQKMAQIWMDGIALAAKLSPDIPLLPETPDLSFDLGQEVYIDFHAMAKSKPVFSMDNMSSGMNFNQNLGIFTWSSDTEGEHTLTLNAVNAAGTASDEFTLTIINRNVPPRPPHGLELKMHPGHSISIAWTDSSDNEMSFVLERSIDGSTFETIATLPVNTINYTDQAGSLNMNYTYRVKAVNAFGSSSFTSASIFVPTEPVYMNVGFKDVFDQKTYYDKRRAQAIIMPEEGSISKIAMYHGAGKGLMYYAVYDDNQGKPGTLLAKTPATLVSSTAGWQEVELENRVLAQKEQKLWLAWVYQYGPGIHYTTGQPGRVSTEKGYSDGMPADFGYSSLMNYNYSIYAVYEPAQSHPVPAPPSNLTVSYSAVNVECVLNWTDNATNEDFHAIERSTNGSPYSSLASIGPNLTTFIDNSITPNNTYEYRVAAKNDKGSSAFSNLVSVTTVTILPTAPADPASISLKLTGSTTIEVSWNDQSDNESGFELERSVNGENFTLIASLTANTLLYNDHVPQIDASYTYRVRSVNDAGESDYVTSSSLFVPSATQLQVVGYNEVYEYNSYSNNRRAQLTYMPEDGTIQKVAMYHSGSAGSLIYAIYEDAGYKPGSLLSKTPVTPVNSQKGWQEVQLETPVFIEAGSKVWIAWVYQYNPKLHYANEGPGRATTSKTFADGMSDQFGSSTVNNYRYSVYALYQPSIPNPVPASPSNLTANYIEALPAIQFSWTDNSSNEEGFMLERSIDGSSFEGIANLSANSTSTEDAAISFDKIYNYRVVAYNDYGNSGSTNIVSVNTSYTPPGPPLAPTSLSLVYNAETPAISLSWSDNANDEDGLILERKVNSGSFEDLVSVGANVTSYVDKAVSFENEYNYRLFAYNSFGDSPFSNEAGIFTSEVQPDPIQVGYNQIFSQTVFSPYLRAQQVTVPANGIIESITMYFRPSSPGNYMYAVYSDNNGVPDLLLGTSEITMQMSNKGWYTATLTSGISVAEGDKVWLAWLFENSTQLYFQYGHPGRAQAEYRWTGDMPAVFNPSNSYSYIYSIYMNLIPSGAQKSDRQETVFTASAPSLLIYPNPLTGNTVSLFIENLDESGDFKLEVYDNTGKLIINKELRFEPGQEQFINLNHELSGSLYYLRVYNHQNSFMQKLSVNE